MVAVTLTRAIRDNVSGLFRGTAQMVRKHYINEIVSRKKFNFRRRVLYSRS